MPGPTDPTSSRNAPRLVQRNGQTILTEHGNERVLQPEEVASAQGYVNDFWSKFSTGFQPGMGEQSNEAYDRTRSAVLGTQGGRDTLRRGDIGTMRGFNTGDYGGDTKARTSVKNVFGRIAARYANSPNSIDAMMNDPDFRAAFPNAKKVAGGAGDKIDFGGVKSDFETGTPVGVVDVLEASDPRTGASTGWQWMPDDVGQGGPANAAYNRTQAAIVGVPNPTTNSTMPVNAVTRGATQADTGDALATLYATLQRLIAEQQRAR